MKLSHIVHEVEIVMIAILLLAGECSQRDESSVAPTVGMEAQHQGPSQSHYEMFVVPFVPQWTAKAEAVVSSKARDCGLGRTSVCMKE